MKSQLISLNNIGLILIGTTLLSFFPIQSAQSFSVTIGEPDIPTSAQSGTFMIDFDDGNSTVTNSGITYTYSGDYQILDADTNGGANNTGKYITNGPGSNASYTISIDADQKYFGFWWSAVDPENIIEFYDNNNLVFSFNSDNLLAFIPPNSNVTAINNAPYDTDFFYGNLGNNTGEAYLFMNFYAQGTEVYDRIDIYQTDNTGLVQSDNHTFSTTQYTATGYEVPVPFAFSPALGLLLSGGGWLGIGYFQRKKAVDQ
ncbi:hypothetical protein Sta7437_2044 [Stanieria cyanosphaera PCC 7437]|uniref:Uncharacterized protein n=1 Tax=Stanieria cyanosphaera (strain ATCC 29371 / PCC 7437) TaxID=111780 RepID=K9XU46_STAC7|nr:hypothetical protein [Stanieria cyanosphaera]AFZ35596.1 hypothetical protein Sta7437_2044 [Stanieria cyanosphaera PCC 7437]